MAYDPNWPAAFEAETNRLRSVLGALALRIEHNGSTSIPGLGAKPIIDIQISVASLQPLAEFEERLGALGYLHVAHPDDSSSCTIASASEQRSFKNEGVYSINTPIRWSSGSYKPFKACF